MILIADDAQAAPNVGQEPTQPTPPVARSPELDAQFKQLLDIYEPQALHPDLAEYLEEIDTLGTVLRHPLVFSIPHADPLNKLMNKQYEHKKKAAAEALVERKWHRYVFLHERPYRLNALMEIEERMDDADFWDLVGDVWVDSENIARNLDAWIDLWTDMRAEREFAMDEDERESFASLPEELAVFRGVGHENAVHGMSWTIDRAKAEWFARRFAEMDDHRPLLAIGTVLKEDVLAYFTGRGEKEVVVEPESVTIAEVVPVEYQRKRRAKKG